MNHIIPIKAFSDNYVWLLTDAEKKKGVVFDPGSAQPVLSYLKKSGIELCGIFITHHHMDHTGGINALLQRFNVPVYGGSQDGIPGCTHPLGEGAVIKIAEIGLSLRVIDTPGHTRGHIVYFSEEGERPLLFSGDTLFLAGCGRIFEGTFEEMYESLLKLKELPGNTLIYCAHEYTRSNLDFAAAVEPDNRDIMNRSKEVAELNKKELPSVPGTIERDLATNPFLRCHIKGVQKAAEKRAGRSLNKESDVFAVLREWKDSF